MAFCGAWLEAGISGWVYMFIDTLLLWLHSCTSR